MNRMRIIGAAVLLVGAVLLAIGYGSTDAPVDQIADTLTGRYTDQTMFYMIAGAAAAMAGVLLLAFGRGRT